MNKELGVFYLMDFSFLPSGFKKMGEEESVVKLFDIVRELGILPIDGNQQNTRSNFNQFSAVNMDLTTAMLGKLNYAKEIRNLAFETVGINLERQGIPVQQTTATGINNAVSVSYAQTEPLFDVYIQHQKKTLEVLLNVAQYAKSNGKDLTINYVDSDSVRHFLRIHEETLPLRRFRIYFENNSKRRSELEILKQIYTNDNTIDKSLEDLAQVISADSVSKVIQIGRIGRELARVQQEQQQMALQQSEQAKIQADAQEKQIQRDFESRENALDREAALYKQAILALGFEEDKDSNSNGISDVMDQLNISLERLKVDSQIQNQQHELTQKRLDSEREYSLKKQELILKDKDIEAKKQISKDKVTVAVKNKNRFDKK